MEPSVGLEPTTPSLPFQLEKGSTAAVNRDRLQNRASGVAGTASYCAPLLMAVSKMFP